MAIFLRQSHNIKPPIWGSPADVQYAIRKNAEKIYQIDPGSLVLVCPYFWGLPPLDYSGKNNHGTNYGATYKDGGLDFDGDDYIDCGGSSSWDGLDKLTISAWFKYTHTSPAETEHIVGNYDNDDDDSGFAVYFGSSDIWSFRVHDGISAVLARFVLATSDSRTHLACVAPGSGNGKLKVYINGVEPSYSTQEDQIGSITNSADNMIIGANADTLSRFFIDSIVEIRISNVAHTADQIVLFHDRPWDLYRPVSRPVYFLPTEIFVPRIIMF